MAQRNKRRHYQAPRIVILGKTAEKNNKPRESASRCAFCGRPLFRESAWHWIYDEFGQRVKKSRRRGRVYYGGDGKKT